MEILKLSQKSVNKTAKVILEGGVVIFPTDTVYGFLADAENKKAVDKIFKLKKRAKSKFLPVFVKDLKMAKELAEIDEKQEKIITLRLRSGEPKYWPGKYTFVLNQKKVCETRFHTKLYGVDKNTIALRIPKYKPLNSLLKKINKPLAQTSVNISGEPPLLKIADILQKFGRTGLPILMVEGGDLPERKSSKIFDLRQKKVKIIRN